MNLVELRDLDTARDYLAQSLGLLRVQRPSIALVKPTLALALEIASNGQPLPPLGFLGDFAALALSPDGARWSKTRSEVPGWPAALSRAYDDYVLGKLATDWSFERATAALRRYTERDRPRGLAYLIQQFRLGGKLGGIELSPAVLRSMLGQNPQEILDAGYESLSRNGPMPLIVSQYEDLVKAARRMAEVFAPEDILAVEQRTALADLGDYVAHRQLLLAAAQLERELPDRPVSPWHGRREVPTRVHDEDQYPVGGYTAISNKGSIESLLHSQLAFIETEERPDLFDLKFVRDELFYYSRDENQFLRRRRAFVFVFEPSLRDARVKDLGLPYQRIVLALAVVVAIIRRLASWLSTDALRFELAFPGGADGKTPLIPEAKLLETVFRSLRESGTLGIAWKGGKPTGAKSDRLTSALESDEAFADYERELAGTAQVQVLRIGANLDWREIEGIGTTSLLISSDRPSIRVEAERTLESDAETPPESWSEAALRILQLWV